MCVMNNRIDTDPPGYPTGGLFGVSGTKGGVKVSPVAYRVKEHWLAAQLARLGEM